MLRMIGNRGRSHWQKENGVDKRNLKYSLHEANHWALSRINTVRYTRKETRCFKITYIYILKIYAAFHSSDQAAIQACVLRLKWWQSICRSALPVSILYRMCSWYLNVQADIPVASFWVLGSLGNGVWQFLGYYHTVDIWALHRAYPMYVCI